MDLGLKGKRALVMGSSQGLGRAVAECLVKEGAEVAITSRTENKLKETANEINAKMYIASDLSKEGEGKRVVEAVIKELGGIDILVTNTGGPAKGNFSEVSLDQWKTDYQSLWLSVIESLNTALPSMVKNQFGRVLMITSLAGVEPLDGLTTSNGLRAGLPGLARTLSNEYAKDGLTFNLILPGYTATDRLKALNLSDDKVKTMVPAGRLGRPEELGALTTFLASDKAGYITGQSIVIDGGVQKSH